MGKDDKGQDEQPGLVEEHVVGPAATDTNVAPDDTSNATPVAPVPPKQIVDQQPSESQPAQQVGQQSGQQGTVQEIQQGTQQGVLDQSQPLKVPPAQQLPQQSASQVPTSQQDLHQQQPQNAQAQVPSQIPAQQNDSLQQTVPQQPQNAQQGSMQQQAAPQNLPQQQQQTAQPQTLPQRVDQGNSPNQQGPITPTPPEQTQQQMQVEQPIQPTFQIQPQAQIQSAHATSPTALSNTNLERMGVVQTGKPFSDKDSSITATEEATPTNSSHTFQSTATPNDKGKGKKKGISLFNILSFIVLLAITIPAIVLGYFYYQDQQFSAYNIQLTNVTDSAFTLTWVSEEEYVGKVAIIEASQEWDPIFAMREVEPKYDDRDMQIDAQGNYYLATGVGTSRNTHHVTIRDLKPDTEYKLRIITDFNGKDPGITQIKTKPIQEELKTPDPGYGVVEGADNSDSIILVYPKADGITNSTNVFSTPISDKGNYTIDMGNFGIEGLKANELSAVVYSGGFERAELDFVSEEYKPFTPIKIKR